MDLLDDDVLYVFVSYLDPLTAISLSQTCRRLMALITSTFREPRWQVILMYREACQRCGRSDIRTEIIWQFRYRLCLPCIQNITIPHAFVPDLPFYVIEPGYNLSRPSYYNPTQPSYSPTQPSYSPTMDPCPIGRRYLKWQVDKDNLDPFIDDADVNTWGVILPRILGDPTGPGFEPDDLYTPVPNVLFTAYPGREVWSCLVCSTPDLHIFDMCGHIMTYHAWE